MTRYVTFTLLILAATTSALAGEGPLLDFELPYILKQGRRNLERQKQNPNHLKLFQKSFKPLVSTWTLGAGASLEPLTEFGKPFKQNQTSAVFPVMKKSLDQKKLTPFDQFAEEQHKINPNHRIVESIPFPT